MTAGAPKTSVVAPISVVIPVYNAERTLERCLEALLTGDCLPAEIVLVDNRSSDEGPEIMGRYAADSRVRIRVEFEPEQGSAAARNRGWRVATQPWVAFLDADCIPDPDWLRALRDRLGSNGTALAGDIRARAPHSLVEKLLAITTTQPSRETVYRSFTLIRGGMPTGNFALPRQMLEELGGLDNGFLIGHDHDLCARLYRAGYRIRFLREAVVRHQNRATWRGMLRQSWGYGEAHAHLLRVHFRRYWLLQIPRKCWRWRRGPFNLWLDGSSPFKISATLAVLATLAHPAFALVWLVYAGHLVRSSVRLLEFHGISHGIFEGAGIALARILKSAAMDLGRWRGSLRYRTWCL